MDLNYIWLLIRNFSVKTYLFLKKYAKKVYYFIFHNINDDVIIGLKELSRKTNNTIDDKVVRAIELAYLFLPKKESSNHDTNKKIAESLNENKTLFNGVSVSYAENDGIFDIKSGDVGLKYNPNNGTAKIKANVFGFDVNYDTKDGSVSFGNSVKF